MTADDKNLRARILGYLAEHRDSTTVEIARGIGADVWDVQSAVCHLHVDGAVIQTGKREGEDGRLRPTYDLQREQKNGAG